MVACSASEVVNEIARLQEMSKGYGSMQSTNARLLVFNEQISGEGNLQILILLITTRIILASIDIYIMKRFCTTEVVFKWLFISDLST